MWDHGDTARVKKRVSETVSPRVMHRIRFETLWCEKSRQESSQESRIGSYAWLSARLSPRLVFLRGCHRTKLQIQWAVDIATEVKYRFTGHCPLSCDATARLSRSASAPPSHPSDPSSKNSADRHIKSRFECIVSFDKNKIDKKLWTNLKKIVD